MQFFFETVFPSSTTIPLEVYPDVFASAFLGDEITNQPCEVPYTPHVNIFAPYHFLCVPLRNFYIAKFAEIKEKDRCPVKFSVNDVTRIPLHFTLRVNQDFTSCYLVMEVWANDQSTRFKIRFPFSLQLDGTWVVGLNSVILPDTFLDMRNTYTIELVYEGEKRLYLCTTGDF